MNITYWTNFSKKVNSTKQPTNGTSATVRLKEPCGIASPVFICSNIPDSVKYIQAFGRYYFVSEVTHNGPEVEISCTSDPMATFKSSIGSYNCYVVRSAAQSNIWLPDAMLSPTNEIVQNVMSPSSLNNTNTSYSTYVVRVVGMNGAKNYIMTDSDVRSAFNTFFDYSRFSWSNVEDSLQSLFDSISQPAQYIQSIKWFPFNVAALAAEHVYFGFTQGPSCSVAGDVFTSYCTVSIPARYYNDFRDYDNRFTTCILYIPGYGAVPIDAKYLEIGMSVQYDADVNTGACRIQIKSGSSVLFTADINIACDIPIGGITGGGYSAIQGIVQILGSFSGTPLRTLSNAWKGLETTVSDYLKPPTSMTGANGNQRAWDTKQVFCSVMRAGSSGKANSIIGSPLMEYKQISNLSGFNICQNASIDINGFDSDRDTINNYLNTGFYYE